MRVGSLTNFVFLTKEADKQFKNLSRLMQKLGTGRKMDLAYRSPQGVYESQTLKGLISKTELFEDNIKFAKAFLLTLDDTLGKVYDIVLKVKNKLVQAANTQSDGEVLKDELTELKNRLLQLAKTKIGDYYIFSGNNPTQVPYDNKYTYKGGSHNFYVKIAENDKVPVFIVGKEVFGGKDDSGDGKDSIKDDSGDGKDSIFEEIDKIINNIQDKETVRQGIQKMEEFLKKIDQARGYVGANEQKLESYELTYSNLLDNLKKRVSDIEDVDMPTAIAEYKRVQTSYQALLSLLGKSESQGSYLLKYF